MALILLLILSSPDVVYLEHSITLDCSSPESGYVEITHEIIVTRMYPIMGDSSRERIRIRDKEK